MRTNVELLAPAGSFEALQAAVQNGCDAVCLGGSMFGARAFAHNFDDAQMGTAVKYARVYGVRVYVTVNTLLYEKEMEEVIAYVKRLQDMDVDALIIQDVGLFTLLHERFPDMELHASTQMHIHNPQGIAMLQEMGAARGVVPRETTIEEIREYAKLGVDLEVSDVFSDFGTQWKSRRMCPILSNAIYIGRRSSWFTQRNHDQRAVFVKSEGFKYLRTSTNLN